MRGATLTLCFLLLLSTSTVTSLSIRRPEVPTLKVEFRLSSLLVDQDAPSQQMLMTPWMKFFVRPSGPPHPSSEFMEYFARLWPRTFPIRVPAGTKPGTYRATLKTVLYVCELRSKVCTQRTSTVPLALTVNAGGRLAPLKPVVLTDANFRAPAGFPAFR